LGKWLHRFSGQRLSAYEERNAVAMLWEITDTIQLLSAPFRMVNCRACYIQCSHAAEKFDVSIV
jgi:hypothetical protein